MQLQIEGSHLSAAKRRKIKKNKKKGKSSSFSLF